MCVICVKPSGVQLPNLTLMQNMWKANSDGAGFMYAKNNCVYIEKGFMTLQPLVDRLATLAIELDSEGIKIETLPFVLHFRIGTHGGNTAANTHPYPLTNNLKTLQATKCTANIGVAHNGIISFVTPPVGGSDTMGYISDILVPLYHSDNLLLDNKYLVQLIENTMGASRFAFLEGNGRITMLGGFKDSKDADKVGLSFSNLNHEFTYYGRGYYGGTFYGYQDDDFDDRSLLGDTHSKYEISTRNASERDPKVRYKIQSKYEKKLMSLVPSGTDLAEYWSIDSKTHKLKYEFGISKCNNGVSHANMYIDANGALYTEVGVEAGTRTLQVKTTYVFDCAVKVDADGVTYKRLTMNDFPASPRYMADVCYATVINDRKEKGYY